MAPDMPAETAMFADVFPELGLVLDPQAVTHMPFAFGLYLGLFVAIATAALLAVAVTLLVARSVRRLSRKWRAHGGRPLPH